VPFGGFIDMPTLCSVKTPITQNGGGNRQIQAQLAKYKNLQIVETTASVPTKYLTMMKTTK